MGAGGRGRGQCKYRHKTLLQYSLGSRPSPSYQNSTLHSHLELCESPYKGVFSSGVPLPCLFGEFRAQQRE